MTKPIWMLAPLMALALSAQEWKTLLDLDLNAQFRPDALQLNGAYSFRRTFQGSEKDPEAYFQVGMLVALNPAYVFGGCFLEAQPVPFIVLRSEAHSFRYLGREGALLSFSSKDAPFGDAEINARKGQEESATGRRLILQATPQLQLGSLAFSHQATLSWWRFNGRGPWFYEYENDVLLRDGDRVQDHQTTLSWVQSWRSFKLYPGLMYQSTRTRSSELDRCRMGVVLAFERKVGRNLRGGLIVGKNLEDRNRKGDVYLTGSFGTSWSY